MTTEVHHTNSYWERPNRGPHPFSTLDQLKELPALKAYSTLPKFEGFVFERIDGPAVAINHVMAIYDKGFEWFVIGRTEHPVDGLPAWDGGKYLVKTPGGGVKIAHSKDVVSVCGDEVTLVGGQVCTKIDRKE